MAEAYDVAVALHCPLGPIALAACLQLDACTYNAFIQEQSLGIHYNVANDLARLHHRPRHVQLRRRLRLHPRRPGSRHRRQRGVRQRARHEGHRWRNPVWRHPDGSVAEW